MARRATAIKQELGRNQGIVLILDAGNTILGQWLSLKSDGKVIIESMNAMGYDAMVVGQMELSKGLDVFRARQAEAKFPFLSANLVSKDGSQLLVKPYVVLERQGMRIGVIGLTEPNATQLALLMDKANVTDPAAAAKKYVSELRDKVDLVVVLSHLGLEEDQKLAKAVPGIDIIVGGNTRQLMPAPERVGNTLVIQQGFNGEWLGRLQATFDALGAPSNIAAEGITLGPEFKDDPDMAALVDKYAKLYPSPTPPPTAPPVQKAATPSGPTAVIKVSSPVLATPTSK